MCREIKLDTFLYIPHTRINSKWDKDLNVRTKTIKIIEENVSKTSDIACGNILSDISPQAKKQKEKITDENMKYLGLVFDPL